MMRMRGGRPRRVARPSGLFKRGCAQRVPSPAGGWRLRVAAAPLRLAALTTLVAAALVGALCAPAAAQVPPDERWRTLETEHFRVTFPDSLEPLGRRAADRAERAYAELAGTFIEAPEGRIDLLVTDHTDASNGFAQVWPSNRIVVFARPPVDALGLGYFDDWLELVITHELAHVVHLDHTANPLGTVVRGVLGRVPMEWPAFPGLGTPRWLTEGLATWYESRLTSAGRVHGTFHEMQLRTAALEGRFEDIGQASGESPSWPGGNRPYAYGSLFFDHLLDRYGEARMAALAQAVAGQWVPYRLDAAGRDAFGVSLSDAWSEWADELRARYAHLDEELARLGPVSEPERLTQGARWALHPMVSPDGASLVYVRSDARSDIQLRVRSPIEEPGRQLIRTNQLATFDWTPGGGLVVAQLEFADPYRTYGDLYLVDTSGEVERLTRGQRLEQPSVSADGTWALAVRQGGGTNGLVRVDLSSGEVTPLVQPDPDVHWAFPSASPDGRWIAVTRWQPEALSDIVILDARSGRVISRVTDDRALDVAPQWSPDSRWLVWSSDRTGILNVLGAEVNAATGAAGAPALLTNVRTGATYPSVDPEGRWLYFSGYHVDGWEVERVPFAPDGGRPAPTADSRFAAPDAPPQRGNSDAPVRDYSPFPTLAPKYWELEFREPVVAPAVRGESLFLRRRELLGFAVGARTSGTDLVGRHAYAAVARVFTTGGRAEGAAAYAYRGLGNPELSVAASQSWDEDGALLGAPAGGGPPDTLFVLERTRAASASATFRSTRWRRLMLLTLTGGLVWQQRDLLANDLDISTAYRLNRPRSRLGDVRLTLRYLSARTHSFQMGGARGIDVFLSGRGLGELSLPDSLNGVAGLDRSVGDVTGRIAGYIPLWGGGHATHVLALRVSGGAASGPDAGPGYFDVGGAAGTDEPLTGLSLFGGEPLLFPVRGYDTSTRFGRFAWSTSAEYRFPLALVNRGLGAWPLHLDRIMGSLFVDAGNAWGPEVSATGFLNPIRSTLVGAGAEITTELLALFDVRMRLRTGVAVPFVEGDGPRVYVRVGVPF